jgi:hypothetical protein
MDRIRVYLYNILLILRHDLNPTRDIIAGKLWHDSQTRHKFNTKLIRGIGFRSLTRLIKWIKLWLIYIILYSCLDATRTRHSNSNCHPYLFLRFQVFRHSYKNLDNQQKKKIITPHYVDQKWFTFFLLRLCWRKMFLVGKYF